MADLSAAIANAREALAKYGKHNPRLDTAMGCAVKLRDLLAALDAAQGEAVGEAGTMPGTSGFTMVCFPASSVPVGTALFAAPQAPPAAVPAGWVAVPRTMTPSMREVLTNMLTNCRTVDESYGELLAAAARKGE